MKGIYVLSSVLAAIAGISVTVIATQYLSAKSDTAAKPTEIAQTTPAQPAVAPAQPVQFESLPLCDQMDAIAKSGKSVAQFIVDSGRYSDFAASVKTNCNWNAEQLQMANAILNPPVVTVQKIVRQKTVVVNDPAPQSPAPQPVPQPPIAQPWNNCNGIREAGESYSVRCHQDQAWNDRHPNWPKSPHNRDNRVEDDFGDKGDANGYFVPGETSQSETNQSDSTPKSEEATADS